MTTDALQEKTALAVREAEETLAVTLAAPQAEVITLAAADPARGGFFAKVTPLPGAA